MVPHTCLKKMNTLFNHFVPRDGLPNPRGLVTSAINSQAISSANRAAEAELAMLQKSTAKRKAHALYNRWHSFICIALILYMVVSCVSILCTRYSASSCVKIGRYVSIHGVTAAA